ILKLQSLNLYIIPYLAEKKPTNTATITHNRLPSTQHPAPSTQHHKVKYTIGAKIFILFLILALTASIAALLHVTVGY
uniref:hypothetical protein n=1 Tax=Pseudomonas lundensis TaxID=86185 RepID=UPI0028D5E74C